MKIVQFEQPSTPDMLQLKYAEAYYNHGNRLGKLWRLDDAIVYYLKALDINSLTYQDITPDPSGGP